MSMIQISAINKLGEWHLYVTPNTGDSDEFQNMFRMAAKGALEYMVFEYNSRTRNGQFISENGTMTISKDMLKETIFEIESLETEDDY